MEKNNSRLSGSAELAVGTDRLNVATRSTGPARRGKRLLKLASSSAVLLLLAGCGAQGTINSDTPGVFNHYVVFPLSWLLERLAGFFGDNYGFALIAVTVLVRLVLMPLMLRQYKSQQVMKGKMKRMKPELDDLKSRHTDKSPEAMQKQQQETMELYKKHGYNPLAIGCLPLLIQLPILTGLYYAIRMTPELSSHTFLWFQLGKPDIILPFVAAAVYFVQAKVSQIGVEQTDMQRQMSWAVYLSPIMMGFFSFTAPAALPLYWAIGGIIVVSQTLLGQRFYRHLAEQPGELTVSETVSIAGAEPLETLAAAGPSLASPKTGTSGSKKKRGSGGRKRKG